MIVTDWGRSCSICDAGRPVFGETSSRGIKRGNTCQGTNHSAQGNRRSGACSRLLPFALVCLTLTAFFAAFAALTPESGLTTRLQKVSSMNIKLPQSLNVLLVL